MHSLGHRGRVIGQQQAFPVAACPQFVQHRADDVVVDFFDGLYFGKGIPVVPGFVRSFDVDAHQVKTVERFDGPQTLGMVIGVQVAGSAFDFENRPSDQPGNTPD